MEEAKYFGVFLADAFVPIYDRYVEKLKECEEFSKPVNLHLQGLSVDELKSSYSSERDNDFIDEYLSRTIASVQSTSYFFCRKYPYLQRDDLFTHLQSSAILTFNKYSSERGSFIHFFRKMMKTSSIFYRKAQGKRYERTLQSLGFRVSDTNEESSSLIENLCSDLSDQSAMMILKIDFENFLSTLPEKTQMIINMYLSSFTLREISRCSDTPLSTVAFCVKKTLEAFTKRYGISH